jgi:two-component system LytT family response regulator
MMKAIVVEDSQIAREGLVDMLAAFPELDIVGQADHPDTALELIGRTRPELIFLDINMPGASGFDLLEKIDYSPRIIFTTAYSEYAVKSFDYNTIDYLLKPISHARLAQAVAKLTSETEPPSGEVKPPLEMNSKIFIKDNDKCHLVTLESIRYLESCKNYVRVFWGQESAFIKKSLNQVEERLPARFFFRANRQYIVNLQSIVSIEEAIHDGYDITMDNGFKVEVSRRQAADLKELLSL